MTLDFLKFGKKTEIIETMFLQKIWASRPNGSRVIKQNNIYA